MNISNGFYSILIILVAIFAIVRGYRIGITRQFASLLGFAFGAVAARVLSLDLAHHFMWAVNYSQAPEFNEYSVNIVCAFVIFTVVFACFFLISPIFRLLFAVIPIGIINRLTGAFFSLVKNILWVSIILNILLCFSEESGLLNYKKTGDGNLIGAVLDIAPEILGCNGADDFALSAQLKEAKSIS